jgi:glycosyltransferase involved in cell wall biosynthesis
LSVIVPAHDEQAVIGRLLRGMLAGADGRLEVVVVANGCRDATAATARAVDPGIHVVEIEQASKIAALNAGDAAATTFPRVYVDADVEVDAPALLALAAALEDGALVASPAVTLDLSGASWPVRAYYSVWQLSAFRHSGHIGSGIYGLSAEGRARFGLFPEVIGDDRFVQGRFAPHERVTLADHSFTVRPPRTLSALVHRGGRIALGNRQLRDAGLAGDALTATSSFRGLVSRVLRRPRLWPAFVIYCAVQLRTKRLAALKDAEPVPIWDRDDSSRV